MIQTAPRRMCSCCFSIGIVLKLFMIPILSLWERSARQPPVSANLETLTRPPLAAALSQRERVLPVCPRFRTCRTTPNQSLPNRCCAPPSEFSVTTSQHYLHPTPEQRPAR